MPDMVYSLHCFGRSNATVMKRKNTYQLKRSAEFNARLAFMFLALLMASVAVNSCNKAQAYEIRTCQAR